MNIQSPVRMDKQAFLAWVQTQEERHELDRGRVLMMTGGSRAHWQITFNLAKALDVRLPPEKYAVLPEFGVDLEVGSIRFPAVVVDVADEHPRDLTATAPVLIAEILSPSSERMISATKRPNTWACRACSSTSSLRRTRQKSGCGHAGPRDFPPDQRCSTTQMTSLRSKRLGSRFL